MTGGWADTLLKSFGKRQAQQIGERLKSKINPKEFLFYSSDLKRAWQTAEIIGDLLHLKPIADAGLREINTGEAVGKTKQWANEHRNPRKVSENYLEYHEFKGAESRIEFFYRVFGCMDQVQLISRKK